MKCPTTPQVPPTLVCFRTSRAAPPFPPPQIRTSPGGITPWIPGWEEGPPSLELKAIRQTINEHSKGQLSHGWRIWLYQVSRVFPIFYTNSWLFQKVNFYWTEMACDFTVNLFNNDLRTLFFFSKDLYIVLGRRVLNPPIQWRYRPFVKVDISS